MIKLIAIDLDGTLLNEHKEITPATKKALTQAKNIGVKVVLCTGRPLLGMAHYLDELNLKEAGDYGITYNGGLVQRTNTGEVLSQKTLTKTQIKELYQLTQELQVPLNFIDLKQVYAPPYPENRDSLYGGIMKALPMVSTTIEELPEDLEYNKAVICIDQEILDEAIAKIPVEFTENYTMMKSRPVLLEVLNKEVDKGRGLAVLCELLDIHPDEVMALGDEENDMAMIEFAGLGVAMGNATDEVKAAAQFVTKSNLENGVAYAVEKFVLNNETY
ncbi:sugar-phosphatase [Carnobacterium gallinarum]|uniref:sugar-phosphatase n=1 Tax=Carnobacterium gallinarum TaxID=2749 RepID=UPI0005565EBA|nr:sugar-phosphatase [Carnobacterium gallinarum]